MKEKLIEIIDTLIKSTESRNLIWFDACTFPEKKSYHRDMKAISEDGTVFEMPVKYILSNDKWIKESSPSFWIKHKDLPGGSYYVYGFSDITKLRDLILKMYCSDMNPKIEDIESILDKVHKGISLITYRDNKISNILGE
jgi:hypothetical protein